MVGAALLGGRLADADPHSRELVGMQMLLDRAQTVVAGQAAADLQPQHRRFEIELVVHDDNPIRFDAETARQRADQTIQAEIPVHLTGEAEGAVRGGILEQLVHTLTVEAKPSDFPPSIEYDVSALEIGEQVYVRDLAVPPRVTVLQDADDLVAQISAPRVAEVEEAAEGEAVAGVVAEEGAAPAEAPPEE